MKLVFWYWGLPSWWACVSSHSLKPRRRGNPAEAPGRLGANCWGQAPPAPVAGLVTVTAWSSQTISARLCSWSEVRRQAPAFWQAWDNTSPFTPLLRTGVKAGQAPHKPGSQSALRHSLYPEETWRNIWANSAGQSGWDGKTSSSRLWPWAVAGS